MKALVGAFNQKKALVGAFSMIVKSSFEALVQVRVIFMPGSNEKNILLPSTPATRSNEVHIRVNVEGDTARDSQM